MNETMRRREQKKRHGPGRDGKSMSTGAFCKSHDWKAEAGRHAPGREAH